MLGTAAPPVTSANWAEAKISRGRTLCVEVGEIITRAFNRDANRSGEANRTRFLDRDFHSLDVITKPEA